MSKKLCICGRSQRYPVCDASHTAEDWTCQTDAVWSELGFCASPALDNLALKLGSHYQGVLCSHPQTQYQVNKLVVLADSSQLNKPQSFFQQVEASEKVVIGFGHGVPFWDKLFPGSDIYWIESQHESQAFQQIKGILKGETQPYQSKAQASSLFLSHAVADEHLIMPVVSYLKQFYPSSIFTCQDSIQGGHVWHETIIQELEATERVIILISQAMLRSTFCAFEIGYAMALHKPLSLISLDGSTPPAFIQHLQMVDLGREQRLRPWLDIQDILIDQLLLYQS